MALKAGILGFLIRGFLGAADGAAGGFWSEVTVLSQLSEGEEGAACELASREFVVCEQDDSWECGASGVAIVTS